MSNNKKEYAIKKDLIDKMKKYVDVVTLREKTSSNTNKK